jgi:hypothetical protein
VPVDSDRGLRALLRGEQQPAQQGERGLRHQAGGRVDGGAQGRGEERTDDEGQLVGDRLEGGGRRHQGRALELHAPAGPHHGADLRHRGAGRHRCREQGPQGRLSQRERRQGQTGQGVHEDAGEQDGALPVAVGETAAVGGEQRHGDTGDGRGGARRTVGTGGVLHQQHDGDGQHRERLACREAGQQERPGAAGAQQLSVSRAGGGDRGCHGPCLSAAW